MDVCNKLKRKKKEKKNTKIWSPYLYKIIFINQKRRKLNKLIIKMKLYFKEMNVMSQL